MNAKELNENLPPIRCYYCNRFLSGIDLISLSSQQLSKISDLKMCCSALLTAREKTQ